MLRFCNELERRSVSLPTCTDGYRARFRQLIQAAFRGCEQCHLKPEEVESYCQGLISSLHLYLVTPLSGETLAEKRCLLNLLIQIGLFVGTIQAMGEPIEIREECRSAAHLSVDTTDCPHDFVRIRQRAPAQGIDHIGDQTSGLLDDR